MELNQFVRGFPFQNLPWFKAKNIEDTLDYVPQDGDIITASYPKTGTTLLQYTVLQILSKGELFPTFQDLVYKYAPYIEISGPSVLESMEKPRVYKHHCPYNMVQKNDKAKYLYTYRKPEDTFISYYNFVLNQGHYTPDLDEYFEDFISGNIAYGSYFDHVLSYYAHKDDKSMLLVSYEKLLLNRREEILRIAKYLGEEYFQTLSNDESVMDKILEHTSFDYMKKNLTLTHPCPNGEERTVKFFRKGIIGDGKQSLKPDQLKRLKDLATERMKGTDLLKEWFDE